MLDPAMRPKRVPKSGTDRKTTASKTASPAVQDETCPKPADTPRSADQVQATFEFVRSALNSLGMSGTVATPNPEVQTGGLPQRGGVDQQVGQALDITG